MCGLAADPGHEPIYTGKDVSYIDTKQANRAAEDVVLGAERFAVFAGLLSGARYPEAALAKGLGAAGLGRPRRHHRIGIRPGLPGPADRLARRLGTGPDGPRQRLALLSPLCGGSRGQTSVVVWNPLAHSRTDIVTVHLETPVGGVKVTDADGAGPGVVEDDGHTVELAGPTTSARSGGGLHAGRRRRKVRVILDPDRRHRQRARWYRLHRSTAAAAGWCRCGARP